MNTHKCMQMGEGNRITIGFYFWMGGDREQRDTVFEYLCSHPFDHGISYVYFMGGFFHTPFGHFPFHLEAPNPIMNVQIMWNWSLLS